jgi:uncharacterized membrane protein YccF (DUF307 family)
MLLAYLHPGDLPLSGWLVLLVACVLIIGVPIALLVFLIANFSKKRK